MYLDQNGKGTEPNFKSVRHSGFIQIQRIFCKYEDCKYKSVQVCSYVSMNVYKHENTIIFLKSTLLQNEQLLFLGKYLDWTRGCESWGNFVCWCNTCMCRINTLIMKPSISGKSLTCLIEGSFFYLKNGQSKSYFKHIPQCFQGLYSDYIQVTISFDLLLS